MASVRKREWTHKGATKTAWVVSYKDASGTPRLKTFKSKADATKERLRIENELVDGTHTADRASATFDHLCDEFMRHREDLVRTGGIRETTLVNCRTLIKNDVRPFFGKLTVSKVGFTDVEGTYIRA